MFIYVYVLVRGYGMYLCVCMSIYTFVWFVCNSIRKCLYACISIYAYIDVCARSSARARARACVCVCLCVCVIISEILTTYTHFSVIYILIVGLKTLSCLKEILLCI